MMYFLRLLCVELWREASLDVNVACRELQGRAVLNVAGTFEVLSFTTVLFVFQIKKTNLSDNVEKCILSSVI